MIRLLITLLLAALAACAPTRKQPSSEPLREEVEFVLANVQFTLAHELGHALIDEFSIPILGNNEEAADTLATIGVLLHAEKQSRNVLADRLIDAADGWRMQWALERVMNEGVFYSDDHPLGIQRFYRIICLVYGSHPRGFERLGRVLDDGSLFTCSSQFQEGRRAVDWVLDSFGRSDPTERTAPSRLGVNYENPATDRRRRLLDALRQSQIVERTILAIENGFELPRPLNIAFVNCAGPTAYWRQEHGEVVMCYGLLDYFADLFPLRDCLVETGESQRTQECIRRRLNAGLPVPR